jgi:hypothetical protein
VDSSQIEYCNNDVSRSLARLNTKTKTVIAAIGPEVDEPANPNDRNRHTRNWPFKNIRDAGKGINVCIYKSQVHVILNGNVQVYVIDTGVNDHSDLAGRISRRRGANVATDATNVDDTNDIQGHGVRRHRNIIFTTPADQNSDENGEHNCWSDLWRRKVRQYNPSQDHGPPERGDQSTGCHGWARVRRHRREGRKRGGPHLGHDVEDFGRRASSTGKECMLHRDSTGGRTDNYIVQVIGQGLHIVNSAGNNGDNRCAIRIGTGGKFIQ